MSKSTNPEIELAYNYICYTDKHIFLTGKAGTGKTTFLHRVVQQIPKRKAVVAPTGVAAINAKGMTIHSLFQLPFGTIVPGHGQDELRKRGFSKKKIDLIRSLDLLIIDEISMVRADVLDAVDVILRRFKDRNRPFGGLQLLMIGDLHQLPPVVRGNEWELLSNFYNTAYFFGSKALQKAGAITIELKHIYRQSDQTFIQLLNKVRNNQIDQQVLEALNSRYDPDVQSKIEAGYITLTSHNAGANSINHERLQNLSGQTRTYQAIIEGDFPQHAFPLEEKISFKVGAQVMFVKNDTSPERRYYNGKIGRITAMTNETITVKCEEDEWPIEVNAVEWQNRKYNLNPTTKQVEENLVGKFIQHPLKLAWAITIHKSQGLTFDKVIIDAEAAFAHGQVYVALSRCRSFEGIVLRSPINANSVKTDEIVQKYSDDAAQNQPSDEALSLAKHQYQQSCLLDLFDFRQVDFHFSRLKRTILENEHILQTGVVTALEDIHNLGQTKVFSLAKKFLPQLTKYFANPELPEHNQALQNRIIKAGTYFSEALSQQLIPALQKFEVLTDNKAVEKVISERLSSLQRELFIKNVCFSGIQAGFDSQELIKFKADAEIDFTAKEAKSSKKETVIPQNVAHPALYSKLVKWRKELANDNDVPAYTILPTKAILAIVHVLPTSEKNLLRIKGIGKSRVKQFGKDILEMVQDYTIEQEIDTDILKFDFLKPEKTAKPPKPDTKKISFDLFQAGKSVEEIATERGLVTSTIEGHLAHFVAKGELPIGKLISLDKIEVLTEYFNENQQVSLSEAKAKFGDQYSWGELRLARAYWEREA